MESILETLEKRGVIAQVIDRKNLIKHLNKGCVPFYIGFDITADSLHVGHFISLMLVKHLQNAGHKPIILIGGGTAQIGDPSGRTDLRKMLTPEDLKKNFEGIEKQLKNLLSFEGENGAIIVNNDDWLGKLNYIEFMKEIGTKFTISRMLAQECYKSRLEEGLTFFEMGYLLMQSYDFYHLYNKFGCKLQIGGNDQWSNIIGGVELIRKFDKDDAFAFTFKLLTKKDGKKMGKSEKGALWLDKERTTPFELYQYFRNISDSEVSDVLRLLTFIPTEEIEELLKAEGSAINEVKKRAGYEIVKIIHGEEEAEKAKEAAESLFENKNQDNENIPKLELTESTPILDILIKAGFVSSKSQGKTLIAQGGILLNEEKIVDSQFVITDEMIDKNPLLQKGKKNFVKITRK